MNRAVIGAGSNIEPLKNIECARMALRQDHNLIAESRFVETKPIGYANQPDYVNGAFLIQTEMSRDELKKWLGEVERHLGRVRGQYRYGPRTIDLDIVVWNGEIVDDDVYERDFLRRAILEVWPDLEI